MSDVVPGSTKHYWSPFELGLFPSNTGLCSLQGEQQQKRCWSQQILHMTPPTNKHLQHHGTRGACCERCSSSKCRSTYPWFHRRRGPSPGSWLVTHAGETHRHMRRAYELVTRKQNPPQQLTGNLPARPSMCSLTSTHHMNHKQMPATVEYICTARVRNLSDRVKWNICEIRS